MRYERALDSSSGRLSRVEGLEGAPRRGRWNTYEIVGGTEDPPQEAFLQLFRKTHTFRGECAFSSRLYQLTANVAFMSFRQNRLATDSLESPMETDDETRLTDTKSRVIDLRLSGLFDLINL